LRTKDDIFLGKGPAPSTSAHLLVAYSTSPPPY